MHCRNDCYAEVQVHDERGVIMQICICGAVISTIASCQTGLGFEPWWDLSVGTTCSLCAFVGFLEMLLFPPAVQRSAR